MGIEIASINYFIFDCTLNSLTLARYLRSPLNSRGNHLGHDKLIFELIIEIARGKRSRRHDPKLSEVAFEAQTCVN